MPSLSSSNNLIHKKSDNQIIFRHPHGNIKKGNNRRLPLDRELQKRHTEYDGTKAGSPQEELNQINDQNFNKQELESINMTNKQCEWSSPKATLHLQCQNRHVYEWEWRSKRKPER